MSRYGLLSGGATSDAMRIPDVPAAAGEIRARGVGTVVVTMGADGIYVEDASGGKFMLAIPPTRVCDVTGAGDALVFEKREPVKA